MDCGDGAPKADGSVEAYGRGPDVEVTVGPERIKCFGNGEAARGLECIAVHAWNAMKGRSLGYRLTCLWTSIPLVDVDTQGTQVRGIM